MHAACRTFLEGRAQLNSQPSEPVSVLVTYQGLWPSEYLEAHSKELKKPFYDLVERALTATLVFEP
jgi:hypothetical protein